MSINPGMCFRDLVGHVQMSSATLKCGLACLNRNEQLFRVAVLPAQPDHFLLVVSLNHTIGNWKAYSSFGHFTVDVPLIPTF